MTGALKATRMLAPEAESLMWSARHATAAVCPSCIRLWTLLPILCSRSLCKLQTM